MKLIRTVAEMQQAADAVLRSGRRVALVPTMGALHDGHVALIRRAREANAAVVLSIYVNPTQFGPNEDFARYPRNLDRDLTVAARESVDVVFAPGDAEMYPDGEPTAWVEELALSRRFEGERRPGHFRGVTTVVAKLFNIIRPQLAVFGEKDFQQLQIIRRMVRDLSYPIRILAVPTVREPDGLARSSRNELLSPEERAQATVLFKALNIAEDLFRAGERNAHRLSTAMIRAIQLAPMARVDYAEIADPDTFEPVSDVRAGHVILLAVWLGRTRLIDNRVL